MKDRIIFIDLFRGWAALVMIEVHVFNALIVPEWKEAAWYEVLNFVNGLVAPSFLFVAGMVFVVVSERKLIEFRTLGPAFRRQVMRIAMIWAIGYLLHLPAFSFSGVLYADDAAWVSFFQSDILQCIALGLALLFGLRVLLHKEQAFVSLILACALASVFLAPVMASWDAVRSLHPFLRSYLDHRMSLFPATPWLGFILGGGVAGMVFLRMRDAEERFARVSLMAGAGMVLAGMPALFQVTLFPDEFERSLDPLFFFLRFGLVLLLLIACLGWVRWRSTRSSFLLEAGRESLLVYVGHLQILYGRFFGGKSMVDMVAGSYGPFACVLATVLIASAMVGAAFGWGRLKRQSPTGARRVLMAGSAVVAAYFFIQ